MIGSGTLAAGGILAVFSGGWAQLRSAAQKLRALVITATPVYGYRQRYAVAWLESLPGFGIGDCGIQTHTEFGNRVTTSLYRDHISGRIWVKWFRFRGRGFHVPAVVVPSPDFGYVTVYSIRGLIRIKDIADSCIARVEKLDSKEATAVNMTESRPRAAYFENVTGSLGLAPGRSGGYVNKSATPPADATTEHPHSSLIPTSLLQSLFNPLAVSTSGDEVEAPEPFNGLWFDDNVLALDRLLSIWKNEKSWYRDRNLPWKLNFLLAGAPGTGKTSFVRALALKHGLHVMSMQLSTFTDAEFMGVVRQLTEMRDLCMLLFEDVDVYFNGRRNLTHVTGEVPLTFSTFLNTIDGVETLGGVICVATTNDVSAIDPALVRPFRFGAPVVFGNLGEAGRRRVAESVLGDWPDLVDDVLRGSENVSGAEFKNTCVTQALLRKRRQLEELSGAG